MTRERPLQNRVRQRNESANAIDIQRKSALGNKAAGNQWNSYPAHFPAYSAERPIPDAQCGYRTPAPKFKPWRTMAAEWLISLKSRLLRFSGLLANAGNKRYCRVASPPLNLSLARSAALRLQLRTETNSIQEITPSHFRNPTPPIAQARSFTPHVNW
jgi:hypothetical protein